MRLLKIFKRPPDFIVGGKENPYMLRWWIIPRNQYFNIYLHKFLRDDDDRALHCHPWISLSLIINGGYIEHLPGGRRKYYNAGAVIFRRAIHRHRIELIKNRFSVEGSKFIETKVVPTWTIFITGPRIREWGFWCNCWRFVPWQVFTDTKDHGQTGRGCEE